MAAHKREQVLEYAHAVLPDATVHVLVGDPLADAPDVGGCFLAQVKVHVPARMQLAAYQKADWCST